MKIELRYFYIFKYDLKKIILLLEFYYLVLDIKLLLRRFFFLWKKCIEKKNFDKTFHIC